MLNSYMFVPIIDNFPRFTHETRFIRLRELCTSVCPLRSLKILFRFLERNTSIIHVDIFSVSKKTLTIDAGYSVDVQAFVRCLDQLASGSGR